MKKTNSHNSISFRSASLRIAATLLLAAALIMATLPLTNTGASYAGTAGAPTASAEINASDGAVIRKRPSTDSKMVVSVDGDTAITINKEIFTMTDSSAKSTRWYYVTAGSKTGYIRADLLKNFTYSPVTATAKEAVNYRTGAGTGFKKKGTIEAGQAVEVRLAVRSAESDTVWYKIWVDGKARYATSDCIAISGAAAEAPVTVQDAGTPEPSYASIPYSGARSDVANALLANPTNGGSCRVVYTFSTANCSKAFGVTGYAKINTPQGMSFDGSKYYLVYGEDSSGQRIVTYGADGTRLAATKFAFNMGHPNGITYDPQTGLCYIFKGNQLKYYTWNPVTNQFGTGSTPYSSSGVAYDSTTGCIYCTSWTGIRVYSADGSFTHHKLINRCTYSGKTYIQDCGAGNGFAFHCVSGSNKFKNNYLNVYRISDGAYLGSIAVTIGELESVIVDNDGYIRMLINTKGNTDYIWKSPLNVYQLG